MAIDLKDKKVVSRLAQKAIDIPQGVTVEVQEDSMVVKGPKGSLVQKINPMVLVEKSESQVQVKPNLSLLKRVSEAKNFRAMTGTFFALIKNMITGVTEGFSKELRIEGVGYRAQLKEETLSMNLGYAHEVNVEPPEDVSFEVPAQNRIIVKGISKEVVGQVAANVRAWRKPLVYGGKGIRYLGEVVHTKEGKKG
ncbi:MAG TPA: 50S ribosomal protein L6 [Thermotogota bacterium]|nr:50S ribosomal protein L6 [Thermotogota bacterium]HRW91361.1 50S ribosomal protein L6 [Thermotogota bacterium]